MVDIRCRRRPIFVPISVPVLCWYRADIVPISCRYRADILPYIVPIIGVDIGAETLARSCSDLPTLCHFAILCQIAPVHHAIANIASYHDASRIYRANIRANIMPYSPILCRHILSHSVQIVPSRRHRAISSIVLIFNHICARSCSIFGSILDHIGRYPARSVHPATLCSCANIAPYLAAILCALLRYCAIFAANIPPTSSHIWLTAPIAPHRIIAPYSADRHTANIAPDRAGNRVFGMIFGIIRIIVPTSCRDRNNIAPDRDQTSCSIFGDFTSDSILRQIVLICVDGARSCLISCN